jgi:hydroxymethylbilane synthase
MTIGSKTICCDEDSDLTEKTIRIGARGSALSMWQAEWVQAKLCDVVPDQCYEIQVIKTLGDRVQNAPLSKIGSTGLFCKEIEQELLSGTIDIAVHSLKDLPTEPCPGMIVVAAGPREDPRDVVVSRHGLGLMALPAGSRVGTSSLRRRAQILNLRPDLEVIDLRGNVDTRLRKAKTEEYDAIVVAAAGILRIGLGDVITEYLPGETFIPAVGQGVIAIEAREGDDRIEPIVRAASDPATELEMAAERAFMQALEGGCQVPIGALASAANGELTVRGMVASLDGQTMLRDIVVGPVVDAARLGLLLADKMKQAGAAEILAEIRAAV